jgi:hypothetical protein
MVKRLRSLRKPVEAPPAPEPKPQPLDSVLGRFGLPGVLIRQGIADFQELRPWWPIVIPLLLWVAVRTYRRERKLFLSERRAAK